MGQKVASLKNVNCNQFHQSLQPVAKVFTVCQVNWLLETFQEQLILVLAFYEVIEAKYTTEMWLIDSVYRLFVEQPMTSTSLL